MHPSAWVTYSGAAWLRRILNDIIHFRSNGGARKTHLVRLIVVEGRHLSLREDEGHQPRYHVFLRSTTVLFSLQLNENVKEESDRAPSQ